ncbi:MAG: leucine-rich repeat domain-containing protein, partial [Candidatus Hermodarchaeota archaeon]
SEIVGLYSLTNLNKLFLSGNNISTIKGLETLQNLETLDLGNNNIRSIRGLESLMMLKDFWLPGNNIDKDLLNQLGGLDSSGCALEPMKFVEYCLINL